MKNKKIKGEIRVNGKKYEYLLEKKKNNTVFLECEAANISQDFLAEDIAGLLVDLPELILAEKEHSKKASEIIQFRVTPALKNKIEKEALKKGYDSVSSFLRDKLLSI